MTPAAEPRSVGLKGWLFLLCVGGTLLGVFSWSLLDNMEALSVQGAAGVLMAPMALVYSAMIAILAAAGVVALFTMDD